MNTAVSDGASFVNAAGLTFSLTMALLLLVLPRKYALVPVLVLVCFMSMSERLVIFNLNFTMVRILLLFGWLRLIIKREFQNQRWSAADKLIIAWVVLRTLSYALVWGSTTALINRLGYAYDILGSYFLFRFLVRDPEDLYRALRYLAIFIGPLALFLLSEKLTTRNPFALFGGLQTPEIRDGVVRCQGPFSHSILAGTFGATTLPLFVGLWHLRRFNRLMLLVAIGASTVITVLSGSSGPALAYAAGVIALCLWPIRRHMSKVKWAMVGILLLLQLVMSQPVWFIMARATVFSGSTGWFRGFLIDMTIRHFSEWWLIGTNAAGSWHYYMNDTTNQYIVEALNGGLLVVVLFICILGYSFRSIGQIVRSRIPFVKLQRFSWALGAALLAHAISFVSVSYFDQNFIMFYLLLAGIGATRASLRPGSTAKTTTPVESAELVVGQPLENAFA